MSRLGPRAGELPTRRASACADAFAGPARRQGLSSSAPTTLGFVVCARTHRSSRLLQRPASRRPGDVVLDAKSPRRWSPGGSLATSSAPITPAALPRRRRTSAGHLVPDHERRRCICPVPAATATKTSSSSSRRPNQVVISRRAGTGCTTTAARCSSAEAHDRIRDSHGQPRRHGGRGFGRRFERMHQRAHARLRAFGQLFLDQAPRRTARACFADGSAPPPRPRRHRCRCPCDGACLEHFWLGPGALTAADFSAAANHGQFVFVRRRTES